MTYTNKQRQRGDAMVIILVILVVALLGGLGYVFWKNQTTNKGEMATDNTSTEAKVEQKEAAIGAAFGQKYVVTYPEGWTKKQEATGPNPAVQSDAGDVASKTTEDKLTLTSPSGDVQVLYMASNNVQAGFTCGPGATLAEMKYSALQGAADIGLAEYVVKDSSGEMMRNPATLFMNKGDANSVVETKDVKAGDSYCDIQSRSLMHIQPSQGVSYYLVARVHFVRDSAEASADSYESADYKAAKEILLSTKQN